MTPGLLHETTIGSAVLAAREDCPDRVAIQCGRRRLTYAELVDAAAAFAGYLRSRGVDSGDRVGLWLPNGLTWVVAHLGIAFAGAVSVPISTRLTEREAGFVIAHSGSRVVLAAERFLGRDYAQEARHIVADLPAETAAAVVAADWNTDVLPRGRSETVADAQPDDAAVVQYTSGTTGRSKGCVLSHKSWTNNARLSAEIARVCPGMAVFTPSPFFHLFGSLTALMGAFSARATVITTPTFDAAAAIETIDQLGVRHMVAVPTVWLDIIAQAKGGQLRSLGGGVWGGGAFPRHTLEHAVHPEGYAWNLNAIYGMTEAPTLTQVRPDDDIDTKINTVGMPSPGVDLCIVDPKSGDELTRGETGEVWARGYNRMVGYLNEPQATAERLADSWIRTGDLGTLNADGYLEIVGRITDMVVTGGANVYASEVEDVIASMPNIALVGVVARSHERLGEVPVAFVTLRDGPSPTEHSVLAFCRQRLASYKLPRSVTVLANMPLTASGKIEKAALKALANGGN